MKNIILLTLSFFVCFAASAQDQIYEVQEISYLNINSAITPATLDYLDHQFKNVPKDALAVVRMNTPGGLVTTTKDIITLIGKQDFPVAVWITPEGASASSAGAIIAASAHFILMAPGTNMGAATPVGLGDDIKESDARNKILSDLAAMVRSLSQQRGRPTAPFEDMIKNANSYTGKEALKLKIIDGVISNHEELLETLTGKIFNIQGKERALQFSPGVSQKEYEASIGQQILEVLANPSTAYFIFLIGIALIYVEFQAPGGFIAGTVGVTFIILAAISFQVLPLNWGAMGLILLGILLLIMEIFIVSYGILSVFGLVSFVMGSLFLFHGEGGFISIQYPVILSTLAGVAFSIGLIIWYLYVQDKKKGHSTDFFLPIGSIGTVVSVLPYSCQVKVKGEIWKASCPEELGVGDRVEVTDVDREHLIILVKTVLNP